MRAVAAMLALLVATTCAPVQAAQTPVGDLLLAARGVEQERAQLAARVAEVDRIVAKIADAPFAMSEPAVHVDAALPSADVPRMSHLWQSLNNCGPASVVMLLSTFGLDVSQEDARLALRGPDWRRGMSPAPVDSWVRSNFGLRAVWRNNGSDAVLKKLVTNGFSPMVTMWMEDPSISRIAHWRTVRGYDDAKGVFYSNDPMLGRGVALSYDWFDRNWQPFSYRYLVIYRPEDEAKLRTLVGDDWNDARMRRNFYERTKADAYAQNTDGAWLAYGEAAYQYGMFEEAVFAFEKGMSMTNAQPFTIRSSYPSALRALGRQQDAQRAAERLNQTALVPSSTVAAPPTDSAILAVVEQRAREAWYASIPEDDKPRR